MELKPIANMISDCIANLILYGIMSIMFTSAAAIGFIVSKWFFLFLIGTVFCLWRVYIHEKDLKDYLISI